MERRVDETGAGDGAEKIAAAKCFADWVGAWFSNQTQGSKPGTEGRTEGVLEHLRWRVVPDAEGEDGAAPTANGNPTMSTSPGAGTPEDLGKLRARLEWRYPFQLATQRKAKSSVTTLRREAEEWDDEAEQIFSARGPVSRLKGGAGKLSAAEIGAAHHKFLQWMALDKADVLAAEAERLARENYLSADELTALDLAALGKFWDSPLGRHIRAHEEEVRRELPFTARFSPMELAEITGACTGSGARVGG